MTHQVAARNAASVHFRPSVTRTGILVVSAELSPLLLLSTATTISCVLIAVILVNLSRPVPSWFIPTLVLGIRGTGLSPNQHCQSTDALLPCCEKIHTHSFYSTGLLFVSYSRLHKVPREIIRGQLERVFIRQLSFISPYLQCQNTEGKSIITISNHENLSNQNEAFPALLNISLNC